eukprot:CAMPEP_0203678904 /NCGR_PEP_ID=MMETSP0090-20130426/33671_1 /ASSEMBLY_ACC=CAM_ASM_001088 /TAXON_ID=426623 /ORGANISM="Chaetoceros affinis, Strain CCMP159" /LENGTH=586 /DNA_ID=CAMNT_0050546347 /DNA_START=107 /DNA_END=1867 /DNA_ORIENTATION=-
MIAGAAQANDGDVTAEQPCTSSFSFFSNHNNVNDDKQEEPNPKRQQNWLTARRYQRILKKLFEGDIVPDYDTIMTNYGSDVVEKLVADGLLEAPAESQETDDDSHELEFIQQNILTDRRWPTRVDDIVEVPYSISSDYSSNEKSRIQDALDELGDKSKVIKFKFLPTNDDYSDYIMVIKDTGCWSFVGHQGEMQRLSLDTYCLTKGIIQHEFMHAVGLFHEQSRPDRDNYVEINWENIEGGRDNHNFEKKINTETLGASYDYGSVMHYPKTAFSSNGKDTITPTEPTNGITIGQRNGADDQDILDMRLLYQCMSGPRSFNKYIGNKHCSVDCKCWEDELGCNGNNNACQGSLICQDDRCTADGDGGGGGGSPNPTPSTSTPTSSPTESNFGGNITCVDDPIGWHDADGPDFTCDWYSQVGYCARYGDEFENEGTTANQACCSCGGGNDIVGGGGSLIENTIGYIIMDGKCLSMNKKDGNAVLWECYSGNNQKWRYDGDTKQLKNMRGGEPCLHHNVITSNAVVRYCTGFKNQEWYVDQTADGDMMMIRSESETGECLYLDEHKRDNLKVKKSCDFSPDQLFYFMPE